ncbi:putative histone-like DNA-binding protein [Prevotella pallens]|uniref:Histone-like DNA-binding protein n=2 Tax=Prevotella pallens TaxID=60133 RepID=A0ABX9DS10_9BACT|nr:putative histone-like DNA-binding protein [Prevotella pallens]
MWWTLYLLIFIFLRMIIFKVKESILKVGPRKGQKAYSAVPKAPNRFSSTWLVERIVRETSLSEGDVRNVLITLRNIVKEIVSLGGALDLGDIFSLRTVITSKMEANEKDVSVTSLKRPHIVVTWKESVRKSLGDIKVEVDNPARKKLKETEEKPAGGGGGQPHP